MLRSDDRERRYTRDMDESLISKIDNGGGVVRESRGREINTRSDAIGGIIK